MESSHGSPLYIRVERFMALSQQIGMIRRLRQSEWLVEPFDPFDADTPPLTKVSLSYLRSASIAQKLAARGFGRIDQEEVWERRIDGLIARVKVMDNCNSDPELTFEIEKPEDWVLIVGRHWGDPNEVLDSGGKLFKELQGRLKAFHTGPGLVEWSDHYKPSKRTSGNWTSATAVLGVRIILYYKSWGWEYCIVGKGYKIWNKTPESYSKPVKARSRAERWARAFRNVTVD